MRKALTLLLAFVVSMSRSHAINAPSGCEQRLDSPKILLVEDDEQIAEAMLLILEAYGFPHVTWVNSAQAGLAYLNGSAVDLIVTDLRMPYMDGLEFMRRYLATGGDRPVILHTSDPAIAHPHWKDDGFVDYLQKPVLPEDFVAAIRRAAHPVHH